MSGFHDQQAIASASTRSARESEGSNSAGSSLPTKSRAASRKETKGAKITEGIRLPFAHGVEDIDTLKGAKSVALLRQVAQAHG